MFCHLRQSDSRTAAVANEGGRWTGSSKVRMTFPRKGPALVVLATVFVALTTVLAAQAVGRSMPFDTAGSVNVNASFRTFLTLPDMSEQTLAGTQKRGREFIYRMAGEECAVLKATIAQTCRLTNINVSARIQEHHNKNPLRLYLDGNAQFMITLKNY